MKPDNDDPLSAWFTDHGDQEPPSTDGETDQPWRTQGADWRRSPREGNHGRHRRLPVLIGATVLLWVVAGGLWVFGATSGAETPDPTAAAASPPAQPSPDLTVAPATSADPPISAQRHGAEPGHTPITPAASVTPRPMVRSKRGDVGGFGDVETPAYAAAEIAVHDHVTGSGERRWVDAAVVEHLRPLTSQGDSHDPAIAIATVQAVVLEGAESGWNRRRRARYAVPIQCADDFCEEAARPWPLPLRSSSSSRPAPTASATTAGDPYVRALTAASYRTPRVARVQPVSSDIVEVHAQAVPPGGRLAEDVVLWVHEGPRVEVVGLD